MHEVVYAHREREGEGGCSTLNITTGPRKGGRAHLNVLEVILKKRFYYIWRNNKHQHDANVAKG